MVLRIMGIKGNEKKKNQKKSTLSTLLFQKNYITVILKKKRKLTLERYIFFCFVLVIFINIYYFIVVIIINVIVFPIQDICNFCTVNLSLVQFVSQKLLNVRFPIKQVLFTVFHTNGQRYLKMQICVSVLMFCSLRAVKHSVSLSLYYLSFASWNGFHIAKKIGYL